MKRISILVTFLLINLSGELAGQQGVPKPKRINKIIELWEQGQPVYYIHSQGGYQEGLKMAQTWADYINYEMEHGLFDLGELREFMRGLVAGGPTKSGHRTPAVIVTLPVGGLDEATIRNNYWVFQQTVATGVHGILLCHARSPEGVARFVESVRFPFFKIGVGPGKLNEGLRGSGSQIYPAQIWGISEQEYLERSDVWPLNPKGEIILGLKIEDRHAVANARETVRVPGISFAEWGGGDMSFSYGYSKFPGFPLPADMAKARDLVWEACKSAKLFRLEGADETNVEQQIREGIMIISAGAHPGAAEKGRRFTKRSMPW
jgi:4-hydroxy-2-oxoheptanedioate aldolase